MISLWWEIGMCKLCIYTWVKWLWSRHRFLSGISSKRKTQVNSLNSTAWMRWCIINIHWWHVNKEVIWDEVYKGCFNLDTVLVVESCSFLWKLLSGVLKPKKHNFPGMKIPASLTEPANVQFSTRLTWVRIKQLNPVAFLDFPNVNELFFLFCYNCFWRICDASVTYNVTFRIKIIDGLPCLPDVGMGSLSDFLAGVLMCTKKPVETHLFWWKSGICYFS